MEQIQFTVPGKPFGKQRPRVTKKGIAYTPKETVNYESLVKMACREVMKDKYFGADEPIGLIVRAYYPIPSNTSKAAKENMIKGLVRPTKKPDCDNIMKIIADALNMVAYADDKQIVANVVEKRYSEQPRVEVVIWPILQSGELSGA